jgi:hypothetical protein
MWGLFFAFPTAALLGFVFFAYPSLTHFFVTKASFSEGDFNGSVTFGPLSYCLEFDNVTTCSKRNLIYNLSQFFPFHSFHLIINLIFHNLKDVTNLNLSGDSFPIQIPQVVYQWVIPAFVVTHLLALIAAILVIVTFPFRIPKYVKISAALSFTVTFLALAFDVILFISAKEKLASKSATSANFGWSFWFTLGAVVLSILTGLVDFPRKGAQAKVQVDGTP